ncbi:hypothetical protein C0J52_06306 [Blattella germanica]|nr:hypothetical protein C0J52_06306 [Blattella germanica]
MVEGMQWFRHISEAAEAYKTRDGKNRRPESSGPSLPLSTPDNEAPENPPDKTKDSEETASEPAKEPSDLLVPPGGSSHDVDTTPSPNENTPLPSSESTSTTPQASPSSAPADGGEPLAKKMGELSDLSVRGSSSLCHAHSLFVATEEITTSFIHSLVQMFFNVEHGAPVSRPPGDGLLSPSPGTQRRRVEPLRLTTEESPLIQPSEVVVSQRPVLTAEPVLTPIEQLRRKDEAIRTALAEKQQLVADILHVPREDFENIAELAGEPSLDKEATELVLAAVNQEQLRRKDEAIRTALAEKQQLVADILHVPREDFENIAELAGEPSLDKEATELVLAAVNQANQLTAVLNDSLRVTEEEAVCATSEVVPGSSPRVGRKVERLPGVPAHRLQSISNSLNAQLTQLLKIIKDRDEERERLRRELQRSREQLHVMHESHRRSQLNASASPSHSRPNSLISQEGSCEPHHESEDDTEVVLSTGLHRSALTGENDDEVIDVSELGTDKHSPTEQHDDTGPDVFVDALSGESEGHPESEPETSTKANEGSEETDAGGESLAEDKKVDI